MCGAVPNQTRSHLHFGECTLPANSNPKWILPNDDVVESTLRGAGWNCGYIERDRNFIAIVVGVINLGTEETDFR